MIPDIFYTASSFIFLLTSIVSFLGVIASYINIKKAEKKIRDYIADIDKYKELLLENRKILEKHLADHQSVLAKRNQN